MFGDTVVSNKQVPKTPQSGSLFKRRAHRGAFLVDEQQRLTFLLLMLG